MTIITKIISLQILLLTICVFGSLFFSFFLTPTLRVISVFEDLCKKKKVNKHGANPRQQMGGGGTGKV